MSLERQNINAKLDPEMHRALKAICDAEGVTMAEFIERILVPVISRRVHEARLIADAVARPSTSGNGRQSP
jgi:hypothetical protein